MVTTEDRMIPPGAQRAMSQRTGATVVEVAASHAIEAGRRLVVVLQVGPEGLPAG